MGPGRISLFLKEDADEYLDDDRVEELIKQYSEFIRFPIKLWKTTEEPIQVGLVRKRDQFVVTVSVYYKLSGKCGWARMVA